MYKRLVRMASGVFVVIFAAAPMSATAIPKTTLAPAASAATVMSRSRPTSARPQEGGVVGCSTNGPYSFSGYNPTGSNYAGGSTSELTGYAFVGDGFQNQACAYETFIGNGFDNAIVLSGQSGIVAGSENSITAISPASFIGSGEGNTIAAAAYSAIVGGSSNEVFGFASFLGGGQDNSATGKYNSALVGGLQNTVSGSFGSMIGGWQNTVSKDYGTIGGGYLNTASGVQATISGGYGNTASGKDATIPGGSTNTAGGINSFAAGYRSTAGFNGDFVWSDYLYGSAGASATAVNQFVARATGGFYLYSSKSLTGVALAPGSGRR